MKTRCNRHRTMQSSSPPKSYQKRWTELSWHDAVGHHYSLSPSYRNSAEYSQCLPSEALTSSILVEKAAVISGRTQTGRQPFKVDLKRIDYLPFRGLLQAAGTEIKAIKAWVGYSCFNNETATAAQSKHFTVREIHCWLCLRTLSDLQCCWPITN